MPNDPRFSATFRVRSGSFDGNPREISAHFPGREIPSWLTVELALSALERLKLFWFLAGRPAKWLEFPLGLPSTNPTSETFRVKIFYPRPLILWML